MTHLQSVPISNIVIGSNVFGWTLDKAASYKILDALFEKGLRTFDTANIYSRWVPGNQGGESERIIGQWSQERNNRDQLTIITKVGMEVEDGQGLAGDYILKACDNSLRRLQTEYIDVYLSHCEDQSTPIADTLEAYQQLLDAQKVRVIGGSNYSFEGLQTMAEVAKSRGLTPYQVYQPEYNLYARSDFEHQYQSFCQQHNIDVIPYFALASGFLTGKYRDKSDASQSQRGEGVVNKYLNPRGERILKALDTVSEDTGAPLAAIALAWLMRQPTIAAPIASVTKPAHIEALEAALTLNLSNEHCSVLDQASRYADSDTASQ